MAENVSVVRPEETFKTDYGKEISNLHELLDVLNEISPASFQKHVNSEKNDFANWIENSVGDRELARALGETTDFLKTKQILADRLADLEKKEEVQEIREGLDTIKPEGIGIDNVPDDLEKPPAVPGEQAAETVHPFATLKRSLHATVRDILIGVVIGLVIGYILGSY